MDIDNQSSSTRINSRYSYFYEMRLAGKFFSASVLLLGLISLAGWFANRPLLRSFWKTGAETKFNAALCLSLVGGSLLLSFSERSFIRKALKGVALFVLLISALSLVESRLSVSFGIDELFFKDLTRIGTVAAGRMAPQAAIAFIFIAIGILLLGAKTPKVRYRAQWVALMSLPFPVQALVGYTLGHRMVVGLDPNTAYMSIPGAIALGCAALGLLLHDPDRDLMESVTARTHASAVFRRLLVGSIVLPLILGWLALYAADGRNQPAEYSVATVALATSLLFVTFTWFNAARLNAAALALAEREHLYSHLVDNLPDVVFRLDRELRHLYISPMVEKISGIAPQKIIGKSNRQIGLMPEVDRLEAACRTAFRTGTEQSVEFENNGRIMLTRVIPATVEGAGETLLGLTSDITQLKRAEAALRESEERYRTLFTSIDEGFCIVELIYDAKGKVVNYLFLEVNPSFAKQTGLTNAPGKTILELAPNFEGYWLEIYEKIARTGEPVRVQNRAEDFHRWYDVYAFRFGVPEKRQIAILFNDITASKEIEIALRDTKARLESTLAATKVATWTWEIKNDQVFADASLAKLFSVTQAEANGGSIQLYLKSIHPEDQPLVQSAVRDALASESGLYEKDYRLIQPDKSIRWVTARGKVERNFDGSPARLSGVIMDITDRKNSEERERLLTAAAVDANAKFRAVFDQSTVFAGIITVDGIVIEANRIFLETCGYTAEQVIGKPFWKTDWWRGSKEVQMKIAAGILQAAQGESYREMLPYLWADGTERVVDLVLHPIRDDKGRVIFIHPTGTDVTDRNRTEEALAKAKLELEQVNRTLNNTVTERTAKLQETVQELEAFSYSIAHDMRSPLRAMVGFSKLLDTDYGPQLDDTARQYLRRLSSSAHRMDRLIIDILNYSKVVRGELNLHPVDVQKLTTEIIESYPALQNVQPGITIDGSLPHVLANEAALTQVISNVLGNAVKFVANGVTPRVRIWAQHPAKNNSSALAQTDASEVPDGFVRFWFEDNGIGIAKESQHRLFKMFMRLNKPEVYEGTGIGLAIVKRAVERMGGSVGIESEPGQGARVWVQLQKSE